VLTDMKCSARPTMYRLLHCMICMAAARAVKRLLGYMCNTANIKLKLEINIPKILQNEFNTDLTLF